MKRILLVVPLIYGALWISAAPIDLQLYLFPWLHELRGPAPFSTPLGNYSPPYLYLLWLAGQLGLGDLYTIKLLSVLGTIALGLAVRRLAGSDAAVVSLLLPTVLLNGPFLGQCDAMWTACCVVAVAMAVERKVYAMAAWAGAGFAFKAQAAFLAPFCLLVVAADRKWASLLIPPAIYALAITPAAIAGWPLSDLLTIYLKQAEYPKNGNAPGLWALASALMPSRLLPVFPGVVAALVAAAAYLRKRPAPTLAAALLSAILMPFLLPRMHERFFLLADVLAMCICLKDKRFVPVFIAVQAGSLLGYADYLFTFRAFRVVGSVCMGFALWRTWILTFRSGDARTPDAAIRVTTQPEASELI